MKKSTGTTFVENLAHSRKEATRRQRIETEQRRDELRDGLANQKSTKSPRGKTNSSLLLLSATQADCRISFRPSEIQARLLVSEQEMQRLPGVNEKISLGSSNSPSSGGQMHGILLSPAFARPRPGQEPPHEISSSPATPEGY
ncbi:hypothetical protein BJ138DRAFT_1017429 [Hygrophoropsis aurantiaca]|uniref:Uncharacterized protein n=1 Tax=Hygrophoropsis aurantiaca TaxID=72124 RepID=A0ACB7ZXX3_9AGAM|nr:hypothetical protein BJ138DRAFT_1017429 [Hygrophoropsis aurantiaca]